ncbi:MAG: ribosome-associated translation inhibitor RaiA [Cellulosilyticaceae bacterium]
MKYNIVGRNIEVTAALENAILDKSKKLDKYFNENTPIQVTLSVEKQRHIIEIMIPFNGHSLRAEVDGKDMYALIDDAIAIIEKQVNKFKSKFRNKYRNLANTSFKPAFLDQIEEEDDICLKVDRKKKFAMKPMDVEEAVMQMELLGHNFFVYLDAISEEVNVVYKRKNGTYGLIEPTLN